MCVRVCVCVCVGVGVCVRACVCVCMCMCGCVYMCVWYMCLPVCVHLYVLNYMHSSCMISFLCLLDNRKCSLYLAQSFVSS